MSEPIEDKAEQIIKQDITNIELISYFKRSAIKTPVFLSVINRNYAEIKPLLNYDLIRDFEPVKSYEFNIDKLENYFYELYQEKIDFLKDEIWRRRRKKEEFITQTEEMTPEKDCKDFEEKLRVCIEFARQSVGELDKMELKKKILTMMSVYYKKEWRKIPYISFYFIFETIKASFLIKERKITTGISVKNY